MSMHGWLSALEAALSRLAAPVAVQVAHLCALGVRDLADELALEFDDVYRPHAAQLAVQARHAYLACEALDRALASSDLGWTFADLGSPGWAEVRECAAAALAGLALMNLDGRHERVPRA